MDGAPNYFAFSMIRIEEPSLMDTIDGGCGLGGGEGLFKVGFCELDVIK